jgi:hypothetical protein
MHTLLETKCLSCVGGTAKVRKMHHKPFAVRLRRRTTNILERNKKTSPLAASSNTRATKSLSAVVRPTTPSTATAIRPVPPHPRPPSSHSCHRCRGSLPPIVDLYWIVCQTRMVGTGDTKVYTGSGLLRVIPYVQSRAIVFLCQKICSRCYKLVGRGCRSPSPCGCSSSYASGCRMTVQLPTPKMVALLLLL